LIAPTLETFTFADPPSRHLRSAWRISQGSSVGFIEERSRINAALQMSELRYVKLRPATHRIWLSDLKKGVGGKDRQTSAGIGLARFMTIRADKASQMEKYHKNQTENNL
jgi:hypothetical protein